MISIGDLPTWLREGLNVERTDALDAVRSRVTAFRKAYPTLTYMHCLYILAMEFTTRKRPRAWMIKLLTGRLNRLRNEQFANDLAHLKVWSFRA